MSEPGEHARLLLEKADEDVRALQLLAKEPGGVPAAVGFHAQQAVEKSLKAVLVSRGIVYPRTHDIKALLKLLDRHEIHAPPDAKGLDTLTPYAGQFRYDVLPPEGDDESSLDARWAVACARRTREWAEGFVSEGTDEPG